jgi:hypothetical protein
MNNNKHKLENNSIANSKTAVPASSPKDKTQTTHAEGFRNHAHAVAMSFTKDWRPKARNELHFSMEDMKHRLQGAMCSLAQAPGFTEKMHR